MLRITQYPLNNQVQCVKEDVVLPAKYHQRMLDEEWYKESIEEWQFSRTYKQKFQQTDKIFAEMHRVPDCVVSMEVWQCGVGVLEDDIAPNFKIFDANSVAPDGSQLYVDKWWFRFADFDLPDGDYYIRFKCAFYEDAELVETRYWISEPLDIKADHPDTLAMEVNYDSNKDDIIYEYDTSDNTGFEGDFFVKPTHLLRFEGQLVDPNIDSAGTDMHEQDYEVRKTSAYAWSNKFLYIGGDSGVPFYIFDKINSYLKADNIYIEGRRHDKESGEKLVRDKIDYYPLYTGGIILREYNRFDAITDSRGQKLLIVPDTEYPYAIYSAGLVNRFTVRGVVLDNNTERDAFVADLNSYIADNFNLSGSFIAETTGVYYQCSQDEQFTAQDALILTRFTEWEVTAAIGEKMAFRFISGYGVVDWGAAFLSLGNIYQQPFGVPNIGANWDVKPTYTYASNGSFTIRVFNSEGFTPVRTMQAISSDYVTWGFTCDVTNCVGKLNGGLTEINIRGADFSGMVGGFSLNILEYCRDTIETAYFSTNNIVALDATIFDNYPASANPENWFALRNISVYENTLDASELANFVITYYEKTPHLFTGNILLRQSPAVTIVNATALNYITILKNAGNFVLYP